MHDLIVKAMATAVVQVFHAHPDPGRWTEFKTGVVCFVKDNLRKSYYIRLLEKTVCSIAWVCIMLIWTLAYRLQGLQ